MHRMQYSVFGGVVVLSSPLLPYHPSIGLPLSVVCQEKLTLCIDL